MLVARTTDEVVQYATDLWADDEPWMLLGGGSNTVVSDEGFPGTVLVVRTSGVTRIEDDEDDDDDESAGSVRIRVQAGHDWDELVSECVNRGWAGVEALSGIPGLAGAAPVQNIGAYGQELSSVLHSIEFLDRVAGEVLRVSAAELELGYRDSAIKQGREGVVLSLDLLLADTRDSGCRGAHAEPQSLSGPVSYAQLAQALGVELGDRVPIHELRESVLQLRASKGMVLDAADHDSWSAGSFFTNPIVSEHFARGLPSEAPRFPMNVEEAQPAVTTLEELASGLPLRVPPASRAQQVKLSAAWLIENAGIKRGFRLPGSGAAISSKHTLAITNRGGASAEDVAALARLVVQLVQQEFGVILAPEPNLYGLEL